MVATAPALLYTCEAVAHALGLHVSTVRQRCERGEIAAVKHGRLWRIPRKEYLRLVGEDGASHEASGGDAVRRQTREALVRMRAEIDRLLEVT